MAIAVTNPHRPVARSEKCRYRLSLLVGLSRRNFFKDGAIESMQPVAASKPEIADLVLREREDSGGRPFVVRPSCVLELEDRELRVERKRRCDCHSRKQSNQQ